MWVQEDSLSVEYGGEALSRYEVDDEGWMKFLKLDEYAPRRLQLPDGLQQVLFPYTEAV